ncbi:Alpha/Beta hydrolase protein [Lophiotrema nucula]|uniref:Alpha/Beta hydrolase protein n=1 Tax=Lophiotrema nucula TaxID=690887 RepID=A0A6A5ZQY9_9PLEO|nr:Alpha/Beta hydrolase protein [Lophiotrema nucula]
MATKPFGKVPNGARQQPEPFELHVDEQKLQDMKTLIRLSPVAKDCYENQSWDRGFGVTRDWMLKTKEYWLNEFDWRATESHINSFPNFKTIIKDDDGYEFSVHFTALFSERSDAIPIALFHGWPGSFLEFVPILSLLRQKYTPKTLPYHIIVPSLPGYTLSTPPPLEKNWGISDTARIMHSTLLSLGFSAYVVQGGDIGSYVSRQIAATYPECKAMHLNFCPMPRPDDVPDSSLPVTDVEKEGLERGMKFVQNGRGYGIMHGTRPSTIGHVLSSSPLALLAWIGEKFLAWVDPERPLPLNTYLEDISLYWLTDSYPTSIYTYREPFEVSNVKGYFHGQEALHVAKPTGYSYFKWEIGGPAPKSWVERTGDVVFHRAHERGGHFAALERPGELLEDIEGFVEVAWKNVEK